MIMTRSPLRISLGGGGTDLPSYYRDHTGFVISAAIDKYVYITVNEAFTPKIILKYSRMERGFLYIRTKSVPSRRLLSISQPTPRKEPHSQRQLYIGRSVILQRAWRKRYLPSRAN